MLDSQKLKSARFHKSLNELKNVTHVKIIFQRTNKLKYFKALFRCPNKSKGSDEDDLINFRRMPEIHFYSDEETGAAFDIDEIENEKEITDKEFKDACVDACHVCHRYARFFLASELFTKFSDMFMFCVIPLYSLLHFTFEDVIIFLCIFLPIVLMQVICDWGKLLEKYSRLYIEFNKLRNSKDENRIDKFQDLVNSFKGSWIYSDMLIED